MFFGSSVATVRPKSLIAMLWHVCSSGSRCNSELPHTMQVYFACWTSNAQLLILDPILTVLNPSSLECARGTGDGRPAQKSFSPTSMLL